MNNDASVDHSHHSLHTLAVLGGTTVTTVVPQYHKYLGTFYRTVLANK